MFPSLSVLKCPPLLNTCKLSIGSLGETITVSSSSSVVTGLCSRISVSDSPIVSSSYRLTRLSNSLDDLKGLPSMPVPLTRDPSPLVAIPSECIALRINPPPVILSPRLSIIF